MKSATGYSNRTNSRSMKSDWYSRCMMSLHSRNWRMGIEAQGTMRRQSGVFALNKYGVRLYVATVREFRTPVQGTFSKNSDRSSYAVGQASPTQPLGEPRRVSEDKYATAESKSYGSNRYLSLRLDSRFPPRGRGREEARHDAHEGSPSGDGHDA